MARLYRSRTNRMLGGIFGGLSEVYGINATMLRLLYGVLALLTGIFPLVVLYFLAWIVIPQQQLPVVKMSAG